MQVQKGHWLFVVYSVLVPHEKASLPNHYTPDHPTLGRSEHETPGRPLG